MKTYKEVTYSRNALIRTTCDMCGKVSKYDDWAEDNYEVQEVTIKYNEGTHYPEGGYGNITSVDLCPECFKIKLVPFLISEGVEVTSKEWDR